MVWNDNRTRKHRVVVDLNDEEYADMRALYERLKRYESCRTFAQYARRMLTRGFVKQIIFTYDIRELLQEVRRIGINVNQIAWKVNRENETLRNDFDSVQREIRALEIEVKHLCGEFNEVVRDENWR